LGYLDALLAAGLDPDASLEIRGDFREFSGYRAVETLLALDPLPTAVFATNDNMAVGLISALIAEGVRVPEDMAVTGFDNITISRYLRPALTTIHVDTFAMGRAGAELLIEEIRSEVDLAPRHVVMPAELVVRRSCGAEPTALARGDHGWRAIG
jgi:LacI family transcriptional regulator